MLKSLSIKHFKSHQDTTLNFTPGVNVIVGRSQAGKTNVLRALLLLSRNRPTGGGYFSNFAGQKGTTKISLQFDDSTISLQKDIRVNKNGEKIVDGAKYTIDQGVLGGHSFEGFGASVPDQIEEKLNLSELNIQEQFDMPFLVMASAGEIARTINRITKLEKVDEWVSKLTTKVNQNNTNIKLLEEQTQKAKENLVKYNTIDEAEVCVKTVVGLTKQLNSLKAREAKIKETTRELIKTNETIGQIRSVLEVEKTVDKVTELSNKISRSIDVEDKLVELIDLEKWISNADKALANIEPISEEVVELSNGIIQRLDLDYELNQLIDAHQDYLSVEKKYEDERGGYIDLLKEIGKCPTCWGQIDDKCLERIEKEI